MSDYNPTHLFVDPSILLPNPWNTNVVGPENEAKLEESIRRFGVYKPVIVREIPEGLEILGGEHRAKVAARLGLKEIPIVNLGFVPEKEAKQISLIDNGRYGQDDALQLAELMAELGIGDLSTFMPYDEQEFASLVSTLETDLDDLDALAAEVSNPEVEKEKKEAKTTTIMRFKVSIADAERIANYLARIQKEQDLTESDALTNAGDALVHALKEKMED